MKLWKGLAAVVLAVVVGCSSNLPEVTEVLDGDSIILSTGEEIRLSHIDAPELNQAYGKEATDFVKVACLGKRVRVERLPKKDYYKRTLGEVYLPDGKNLNHELVKEGLAWHYRKYSNDRYYQQLEFEARAKKKGLWAADNPKAPWDWRHAKR